MTYKTLISFLAATVFAAAAGHSQDSFSDDFDRPDSFDIGEGWNEMLGIWEIFQSVARPFQEDLTLEKVLAYDPIVLDRAFVVEADIEWTPLRSQWNGIVWNIQSSNTYYLFRARADNGNVQLIRRVDGANAAVLLNAGGAAGVLEEGVFHRLTIRGNGEGTFWWSVKKGEEVLASGSVTEEDPLPDGPAGIYAGREAIEVDRFSVDTYDLGGEVDDLEIATAVEVFFTSVAGELYQIQSSADLEEWVDEGDLIEGDGEEISRLFSTRDGTRRFFRVLTSVAD